MTSQKEKFAQLIGTIIHNCGMLELLTNRVIDELGKDELLTAEISTLGFERRIKVLRLLLKDRTKRPAKKVDSFCELLLSVAEGRNVVAHNPVLSESSRGTGFHIINLHAVTDATKAFNAKVLTEKDLGKLLERTREALREFESVALDAGIETEIAYEETKV